jgi:ketosteroid isomerase-like protein
MTVDTHTRQTVRAYHDARFLGDVPAAVAHLAERFTFQSPLMNSDDAVGHLAGLAGFLQVVTGVDMISELYGETEATLVYDVHTATPVGTQRTAEHFRLQDGRIASITLIFDATAWRPMMTMIGPATSDAATQTP